MFFRSGSMKWVVAVAACVAGAASGQTATQALKDAWVATSERLLAVDHDAAALVVKNDPDEARSFKAIAFEPPVLGAPTEAVRALIAVDGTEVWRFENGSTEVPPTMLFDAAVAVPSLRFVTAVAVTDRDSLLIAGYSRPKRVFEIWEATLGQAGYVFTARATSTPQLTDAVYVPAEDALAGPLAGGGLLATAGKHVLFFPKNGNYLATVVLADGKALGLKGAAELTSADLVRKTNTLMVATTERALLTKPVATGPVTRFATVPAPNDCGNTKPQRLLVRNAHGGENASSYVADAACRQVLRYDFVQATSTLNEPAFVATSSEGAVALAVGEGNEVTCTPNVSCPLISGGALEAIIDAEAESNLLVFRFTNLCDRRVAPLTCTVGTVDAGSNLVLNSLLPPAVQTALGSAQIKIPPYMFAAGFGGEFGVVFVQADEAASDAPATIELDVELLVDDAFEELGVNVDFARPTSTLALLNQDIAAYAPDNPSLPTVRQFEATPITTGVRNPMIGALRGFSAIIYGLQHDVNPPSPRAATGGVPPGTTLAGSTPLCALQAGGQSFVPVNTPSRYFVNLAACLFADEETLLTQVIPPAAFVRQSDRTALLDALAQTEDKVIKALSGAGPNTGAETFQALLTQLDQFDAAVAGTAFVPSLEIYKNELAVRSKVFRFNLLERTYPSLPISGF